MPAAIARCPAGTTGAPQLHAAWAPRPSHAIAIQRADHPLYCRPGRTARRPPSSPAGPTRASAVTCASGCLCFQSLPTRFSQPNQFIPCALCHLLTTPVAYLSADTHRERPMIDREDREFEVAAGILEDCRRYIAAHKIQRWDVVKWGVSVNLAPGSRRGRSSFSRRSILSSPRCLWCGCGKLAPRPSL